MPKKTDPKTAEDSRPARSLDFLRAILEDDLKTVPEEIDTAPPAPADPELVAMFAARTQSVRDETTTIRQKTGEVHLDDE